MYTRIVSGLVATLILFVVALSPKIILGICILLVSLFGIKEFYDSFKRKEIKPIKTIGYLACIPVLFVGITGVSTEVDKFLAPFNKIGNFSLWLCIVIFALFAVSIIKHKKYTITDISVTFFGILYVPFLFTFLELTRNLPTGYHLIWLIFIGAWATDTFAYFTGMFFGKHKIMPEISPKKTVEGSIGGVIGCVIITSAFGFVFRESLGNIEMHHFIILGLLNGVFSQMGDWAASSIKRYTEIKDFGTLIPGHGGVLDRFDSLLFIAPVVYFYITNFL